MLISRTFWPECLCQMLTSVSSWQTPSGRNVLPMNINSCVLLIKWHFPILYYMCPHYTLLQHARLVHSPHTQLCAQWEPNDSGEGYIHSNNMRYAVLKLNTDTTPLRSRQIPTSDSFNSSSLTPPPADMRPRIRSKVTAIYRSITNNSPSTNTLAPSH